MRNDWTSVSVDKALVTLARRAMQTTAARESGVSSVSKFVELAMREKLERMDMHRFEHVSTLDDSIRILDSSLTPMGTIVTVSFKDESAWCSYCDETQCVHVQYAWSIPEIRDVLEKRGLRQISVTRNDV